MTPDDIKALRAKLGLTQAKLAAKVGVTLGAVQHWEAGIRKPSGSAVKMLKRIGKGKGPAKENS